MIRLLAEAVSKAKTALEPLSKTVASITTPSKLKLSSANYSGRAAFTAVSGLFFTFYNLIFGDSANIADSKAIELGKGVADSYTATDSKLIDVNKVATEQLNLADTVVSENIFFRQFYDSYNISESSNVVLLKQLSDTNNFSDALSVVWNINRNISDQLSATDDVNGAAVDDDQNITFFSTKTDLFSVGDYIAFENIFSRPILETTNVSSSGVIFSQNYTDGPSYFLEDYVGVSRTIT